MKKVWNLWHYIISNLYRSLSIVPGQCPCAGHVAKEREQGGLTELWGREGVKGMKKFESHIKMYLERISLEVERWMATSQSVVTSKPDVESSGSDSTVGSLPSILLVSRGRVFDLCCRQCGDLCRKKQVKVTGNWKWRTNCLLRLSWTWVLWWLAFKKRLSLETYATESYLWSRVLQAPVFICSSSTWLPLHH